MSEENKASQQVDSDKIQDLDFQHTYVAKYDCLKQYKNLRKCVIDFGDESRFKCQDQYEAIGNCIIEKAMTFRNK